MHSYIHTDFASGLSHRLPVVLYLGGLDRVAPIPELFMHTLCIYAWQKLHFLSFYLPVMSLRLARRRPATF